MKKIVIFDLDGTLLNTLEDLTDSTNFALKNCGYPIRTIEEIRNFVGNGVFKLIERALPGGSDNKDFNKCLETFKNNYCTHMYNKTTPYKGITQMLKKLKTDGYKIAVVSNKFDKAVKELCDEYFPEIIDFASGENEKLGIRKKPYPDTVLQVLKQYSLSCEDAIYVGDSEVDIQTAQNSDMPCISVTWGFKDKDFLINNGAKILADKPEKIIEILKGL